jgi:two-component system, sensor histidine kinase and response regulator
MDSIRILLIEDNPADTRLIREALIDSRPQHFIEHRTDLESGLRRLVERGIDCVLLDLTLPDSRGLDTFRAVHAGAPHVATVILSAFENDELALAAVQLGAQDYVPKGELTPSLLARCIRYALERKRAQAEVLSLNSELENRVRERTRELAIVNQELEAFGYSIAHDLRRPLRAIDGFAAILHETCEVKLDPQERHYFDRIRRACRHMDQLIDALLAIARLTHQEMRHERVDLTAVADEIIHELRRREPARVVRVVIAEDMAVSGDASLLRAALENLIGNAWKFTRHRNDALIEVGNLAAENEHTFFVRDNGAGFDMAYSSKLFKPFERLHLAREFEGLGIGLTAVDRIVWRHGGQVWAEAAADQGATFYFALQKGEALHHGLRAQDCAAR